MIKNQFNYKGEHYTSQFHINEAKLIDISQPVNQCIEIL